MTDTAKATEYIVAETNPARVVEVTADIGNARSVVLVREAESATPTAVTMPSIRSLHGAFSYELFAARGLAAGSWSKLRSGEHVLERDGTERLYFVVETKSSLFDEDLRDREGGKIKCGTAHFKALAVGENPAVYGKFKDVAGLMVQVIQM